MNDLDLIDSPHDDLMAMMRRVHELAVSDFASGRRTTGKRTGPQILADCMVGRSRNIHMQLATTIYNVTIKSLAATDARA